MLKKLFQIFSAVLPLAATVTAQVFQSFDLEPQSMANPRQMEYVNQKLLFFAHTDATGEELWAVDGNTQQVTLLKDIYPGPGSSSLGYTEYIVFQNKMFFVANDSLHGTELWVTDGTAQGTQLLKDIAAGADSSWPGQLIIYQNKLFFSASSAAHGQELWATDGTPAGTYLVKDIQPGAAGSYPTSFTVCHNTLYFSAFTNTHGAELWKTDGTVAGTQLVKDLTNDSTDGMPYYPFGPVCLNNRLIFAGQQTEGNLELWASDGTAGGTTLLKDIHAGPDGCYPAYFTVLNNLMFFSADNGVNGQELWKTDGTPAGTNLVMDIRPGSEGSYPHQLFAADSILLFAAEGSNNNVELWKSNGTHTSLLKNINSLGGSYPERFFRFQNKVYFTADDGINGKELWVTDGTATGTVLFKDLNTHLLTGSYPHSFTTHGQKLFFIADTGPLNDENFQLFITDGTIAGTMKIAPAGSVNNPFNSLFFPFYLTSTQAGLFFKAGFEGHYELWRYGSAQNPSGLPEVTKATIHCYPNPFAGMLRCYSSVNQQLNLYTIEGKLLQQVSLNKGVQDIHLHDVSQPVVLQPEWGKAILFVPLSSK